MLILFVVFGVITLIVAIGGVAFVVAGLGVSLWRPLRRPALLFAFVVLVTAAGALVGSWGLSFTIDGLSSRTESTQAWEALQVLAIWAWPIGLVSGGALGFLVACSSGVAVLYWCRTRKQRAG